jgi:branched-chain amino acid transport system permease protein
MNPRRQLIAFLSIYLFLLVIPVFIHENAYVIGLLIACFVWGTLASVWNFIMGYAGIFTFGQLVFFVIGAYTSGMVSRLVWSVYSSVSHV